MKGTHSLTRYCRSVLLVRLTRSLQSGIESIENSFGKLTQLINKYFGRYFQSFIYSKLLMQLWSVNKYVWTSISGLQTEFSFSSSLFVSFLLTGKSMQLENIYHNVNLLISSYLYSTILSKFYLLLNVEKAKITTLSLIFLNSYSYFYKKNLPLKKKALRSLRK